MDKLTFLARHIFAVSALALLLHIATVGQNTSDPSKVLRWFKGNTHTHTKNSDGDSPPEDVVDWYSKRSYDFLFITDHEHITETDSLNAKFGNGGKFLVIRGQEVTDRFDTKPYHVNGLGLNRVVMPGKAAGIVNNIQTNVDGIRSAGGVPQINHPNYGWAITADDLFKVNGAPLVEIFSGHPLVNMSGGGGSPSVEQMWDDVLTRGRIFYGVAVDDSHSLKRLGDSAAATPGHGWVVVRASELTPEAILGGLERGDFYASSGVELNDYSATPTEITITIREKKGSRYRTQFIGAGGKVLSESISNPAIYRFKGNEPYVRAKVFDSNGKLAWTQPVFRKRGKRSD